MNILCSVHSRKSRTVIYYKFCDQRKCCAYIKVHLEARPITYLIARRLCKLDITIYRIPEIFLVIIAKKMKFRENLHMLHKRKFRK